MKWIFFLLISRALFSQDLLLYPLFEGDFFGFHYQKTELSKGYGVGAGKKFQSSNLGFSLSGTYQKKFYDTSVSNPISNFTNLYFGLHYFYFYIFGGYGNNLAQFGFSFQVHPEKQILIFRTYSSHSYSDNLALFSGKEIQLKLILARHYEVKPYSEISFGVSFPLWNFHVNGFGKSNETSSDIPFGISIAYFQNKSTNYLFKETKVNEENFPKPKKPIKRKRLLFPKLFNKKTYIYPLSIDELLNKKIPLREALLIHEASKDPTRYNSLLKTLPKDTQAKCHSLQKLKREQNEN